MVRVPTWEWDQSSGFGNNGSCGFMCRQCRGQLDTQVVGLPFFISDHPLYIATLHVPEPSELRDVRAMSNRLPIANSFPIGILTSSLGNVRIHRLEDRLREAADAGFQGVEMTYPELTLLAEQESEGTFDQKVLGAAHTVKTLLDEYNLKTVVLQPFDNYEGLTDPAKHADKIAKLKLWFKLAKIFETDLIQIPAQFGKEPDTTGDFDKIVNDFVEISEMGLKEDPPIRFAYEACAWSTYHDTWQHIWTVVDKVDRPNFGLCLDTYHVGAIVWADIMTESGIRPNADDLLKADLAEFAAIVPPEKIFFVQLSDAERVPGGLKPGHPWYSPDEHPNASWNFNARIYPCEHDTFNGYLPVEEIVRSWVYDCGYRGWFTMEIFNRTMADPSPEVPRHYAKRGQASWKSLVEVLKLNEVK
ncbi:xylose isomerase-like protein [Lipomyces starkeyi]